MHGNLALSEELLLFLFSSSFLKHLLNAVGELWAVDAKPNHTAFWLSRSLLSDLESFKLEYDYYFRKILLTTL